MAELGRNRDYPIPQLFYVHVRERTKGTVSAFVGPNKLAMSDSEDVVSWDGQTYSVLNNPEVGIRPFIVVAENQYAILLNPAPNKDDKPESPRPGASSSPVDLRMGERVVLHGPQSFALWPMQTADVIDGHTMKSNEYILVEVVDPAAAQSEWDKIGAKANVGSTDAPAIAAKSLQKGQRLVIKGTEVSFFMPVTGMRVVTGVDSNYLREAVTLEMLEYCILLDENGSKRIIRGPDVVFPNPTEEFVSEKGSQVFRAIELSTTSGIHVKVTADYKDGSKDVKAGEELFISGAEQAIYFPRAEHAIIEYESIQPNGTSSKERIHYASAVPKGSGRYVLDRGTGEVSLKAGPAMLLLNPAKEVLVQRVLSTREAELWFPGNRQAAEFNRRLTEEAASTASAFLNASTASYGMSTESLGARSLRKALVSSAPAGGADSFDRKGTFTPPKTVKLDDRYSGAVSVSIWPGYAIQVVDKSGDRRVEVGPRTVLLAYSEDLTRLQLSTGKPKTTDALYDTVYLKVRGNQISDTINVTTVDHIDIAIKIAYQVNFTGDESKWFDMENYVKLICDFNRSVLKGRIRQVSIQDITTSGAEIIREAVLGKKPEDGSKRPGRVFEENGAHIYECEVLDIKMKDEATAAIVVASQRGIIKESMDVATTEAILELTKRAESAEREIIQARQETDVVRSQVVLASEDRKYKLELERGVHEAAVQLTKHQAHLDAQVILDKIAAATRTRATADSDQLIARRAAELSLDKEELEAATAAVRARVEAITPELAQALNATADNEVIIELSKSLGVAAYVQKQSVGDLISGLLKDSPISDSLARFTGRK